MHRISFGTSGWRGILCEDFTFETLRAICQAIADLIQQNGTADKGLVVGYDTRFMGKEFARESVRVLTAAGIPCFLCDRDTPTPVISFELLRRGAAGGLVVTGSHNGPTYNGIKYLTAWGGLALPETTKELERRANEMLGEVCYRDLPLDAAFRKGLVQEIDPKEAYFARLRELVDFSAIARSGMRIAVNPLFGTSRGYLDRILENTEVDVVHFNHRPDPTFGGLAPEPAPKYMNDFITMIGTSGDIQLGLATDGDGDRYGVVDQDGSYVEPGVVLAMVYDYLLRRKGEQGNAARSVATSHCVDAVAQSHGFEVFETPVGFKYIGDLIAQDRILIGGEESAGLAVQGHVPEKDGILACLLVAEMVAREGATLRELKQDLCVRVGEFHTHVENVPLTSERSQDIGRRLHAPPDSLAGRTVDLVIRIDGYKLVLEDGAWVLFRFSGTEPVLRIYAEASSPLLLNELVEASKTYLLG